MRSIFRPILVNGPFADPALFVDVLFARRALLFDLGDIAGLQVRCAVLDHSVPCLGFALRGIDARQRLAESPRGARAGARRLAEGRQARDMVPFHFSPRYANSEGALVSEAREAF